MILTGAISSSLSAFLINSVLIGEMSRMLKLVMRYSFIRRSSKKSLMRSFLSLRIKSMIFSSDHLVFVEALISMHAICVFFYDNYCQKR